ncbi:hypothetical protein GCM10009702_10130 [Propioniferax innocua]
MQPGVVPLRPLNLGDVLGGAMQMYRFNPRAMLLVPMLLIGGLALALAPAVYFLDPEGFAFDSGAITNRAEMGQAFATLAGVMLPGLLTAFVSPMVSTATHGGAIGLRTGPFAYLRTIIGRGLVGIVVGLLVYVIMVVVLGIAVGVVVLTHIAGDSTALTVAVGIVMGILAMAAIITVSTWMLFAPYVVYREGVGPITAMRRSYRLVRHAFWRTLGIYFLLNIIGNIISSVLSYVIHIPATVVAAVGEMAGLQVASTVLVTGIGYALLTPLLAAGVTMLYLDRRIRTEGFDVELGRQAQQVAADPASEQWLTSPAPSSPAPPNPAPPSPAPPNMGQAPWGQGR